MIDQQHIRVGVIGAGSNTTGKHIPNLQALDGVEIISVCNRSRASSQRVADQFGIPTVYDDWQTLVAAPDTNAIVIGTWPYLHHPATLAALAADKHVLVEARMAMNATEARTMLAAAQARPHLVTQVVPSPLSFHVDATLQRLIAEGYLGELLAIEVRDHNGRFLDTNGPLHWRQDKARSGLNILSLGIWYESLMRWVGPAARVMAMGQVFVKMRRGEDDRMTAVSIPEHLTIIADMVCGAQATFSISQVTGLVPAQSVTLYGSGGTLRYAGGQLSGGQPGDDALAPIPIPDEEKGAWRVEEEFVSAIRGQETISLTTFSDGLKYMHFTEAVARSMASGKAISLMELG